MFTEKVILHIPVGEVDQPIICQMSHEFDVVFNILKAEVTEDEGGLLILGLTGKRGQVVKAIDYLRKNDVVVERLGGRTTVKRSKCTDCGACVAHCPTEALSVNEDKVVKFVRSKCIACGLCVPTCPYEALEMTYSPESAVA